MYTIFPTNFFSFVIRATVIRNADFIDSDFWNFSDFGSNFGLNDQLCEVVGKSPAAGVCAAGSGAIVLALNKDTGDVVWRT